MEEYATPSGASSRVPGAPGIKHRIDLNRLTGNKPLSYFTGREHTENGGAGFEYVGIVKITASNAAIRSGAGSQYSKLATAAKGALFERRPGDTGEWYTALRLSRNGSAKQGDRNSSSVALHEPRRYAILSISDGSTNWNLGRNATPWSIE